jgi:hypothetical protein
VESPLVSEPARQAPALDIDALEGRLPELHDDYVSASPYPHVVIDDFLTPEAAARLIGDFPPLEPHQWNSYLHANEKKFSNTQPETWPGSLQSVLDELQSDRFVKFLGGLTGIDNMFSDASLEGGGLHQSLAGGFLNVHADFTVHPRHRDWQRRVNLLLYLNKEWPEEFGGKLELWSKDMKSCERTVAPVGNRVLIFNTDADSFHGHPDALSCPPEVARQSLALYYFTHEDNPVVRSTEYRARPGEGAKSVMIYLDKQALRVFDRAKRRFGISDHTVSGVLRGFERLHGKNGKKNPPHT